MNIVPSVVAAGVAQTGLQAQQLGRRRAARAQQAYKQTREIQETAEIHLRAVGENDEGASAGVHVSITSQMPDHHTPDTDQTHHAHAPKDTDDMVVQAIDPDEQGNNYHPQPDDDADTSPKKPHRHVDVKA